MATKDFIKLQRDQVAATECAELLSAIRDLRSVYERFDRIRAKMRRNFDDAGGAATINWGSLETLWGIPAGATSVGVTSNGARVFTYVDGVRGAMDGVFQTSAAKDITESVG